MAFSVWQWLQHSAEREWSEVLAMDRQHWVCVFVCVWVRVWVWIRVYTEKLLRNVRMHAKDKEFESHSRESYPPRLLWRNIATPSKDLAWEPHWMGLMEVLCTGLRLLEEFYWCDEMFFPADEFALIAGQQWNNGWLRFYTFAMKIRHARLFFFLLATHSVAF